MSVLNFCIWKFYSSCWEVGLYSCHLFHVGYDLIFGLLHLKNNDIIANGFFPFFCRKLKRHGMPKTCWGGDAIYLQLLDNLTGRMPPTAKQLQFLDKMKDSSFLRYSYLIIWKWNCFLNMIKSNDCYLRFERLF